MVRTAVLVVLLLPLSVETYSQSPTSARPEFEVASVRKIVRSDGRVVHSIKSKPSNLATSISGDTFRLQTTVPGLMMDAYNVREDQLSGLPNWADDSLQYEILAKAPGRASVVEVRSMLQSLLMDRFKLRLRHESKSLPVYELTLAAGGTKLVLFQELTPEHRNAWARVPQLIELFLDYPIVDKTGLTGYFDTNYSLKWNDQLLKEEMKEARPSTVPAGVLYHGLAPSIFREVEREYGVRLKKVIGQYEFLVVEHIEHPSEN